MGDSVKNLKLFREVGLNEWFLSGDKFQSFFTWFGENITDETILQETEIREYEQLEVENAALEPKQLERELKTYENELSDIRNGDQERQRLQAELEMESQAGNALDELIIDVKKTIVKIEQQTNVTEMNAKHMKTQDEEILMICLQVTKEVHDAQQENFNKLKELNRFYATDHLSPIFIHQMRMDQVYGHCDSFVKHLELILQICFKVENVAETDIHDESTGIEQQIAADLDVIKTKIFQSTLELTRQQTKLAGQKSINANIPHWTLPGAATIEKETTELRRKNEEYYRLQVEASQDSLKAILHHLASLEVETAAFDNTESKLNRAHERFTQLCSIKSIVSDELMNAELLWLFMQFDIEKLRHRNHLNILDQYQTRNLAALYRMDLMRQAFKMPFDVILNNLLTPLNSLLASHLGESAGIVPETFQLYDKMLKRMRDYMQRLVENKDQRLVSQLMDEINGKEQWLRQFVRNGPVSKSVLYNVGRKNTIFTIKAKLKQIEDDFSGFKSSYLKNYSEPMQKDRLWQGKQLLWIWFLTEPKTMLRALKYVQAAAKEHAARSLNCSTKPVSGILRRE